MRGPFPVLYLLHGLSDDHTIWARRTNIDRYVENLPLIVVMPDGGRSFYCDAREGAAYETAIARDLVAFIDQSFPTVRSREGRGLNGNSMGGYGAVRLAVRNPDLFGSAHAHSAAFDFGRGDFSRHGEIEPEMKRVTGDKPRGTEFDLQHLIETADRATLPALRFDCGVDDFLIEPNREFRRFLASAGVEHEYVEHPGAHDWEYWDKHIQAALAWQCKHLGIG
jgi:S-formylglutathione hydrolase FrmB